MTIVVRGFRPVRVGNSSLYEGSISGRYIKGRLSRSPSRKGPCARV